MTFHVWLSLLAACAVITLTPGAGAINTMTNSLTSGWRRSIWGILGQQLALIIHIVIVAAGVGVFVAKSPVLFAVIRYVGAAYLVYLGVRMLIERPKTADAGETGEVRVVPHVSNRQMFIRGMWVNLLNPKAIVFFLAFLPQFIRLDMPQLPQYLILIGTVLAVDTVFMWGFFAAAARPFGRFSETARGQRVLNSVFGVLFIGVAALMLFLH